MQLPNYNCPKELQRILELNGLGMQKRFGQNFMINEEFRKKVIAALQLSAGMTVWEVGPGLGAMTSMLLNKNVNLTAFEIDRGFICLLKNYFGGRANFQLVEGDVLKTWKEEISRTGIPHRFFGNLPYNIAAILIANTIEAGFQFDLMAVTVQKEIGERMAAAAGTSEYSSFSVLCQAAYTIKPFINLPPQAFWPKPNVKSQTVVLQKREAFLSCKNPKAFASLVRTLFSARRKTIKNNLSAQLKPHRTDAEIETLLQRAGLAPNLRAEVLTVDDFFRLYSIMDTDLKKLTDGRTE